MYKRLWACLALYHVFQRVSELVILCPKKGLYFRIVAYFAGDLLEIDQQLATNQFKQDIRVNHQRTSEADDMLVFFNFFCGWKYLFCHDLKQI